VVVPRAAVQSIDGRTMLFVKLPDGSFEAREVALGATGSHDVEVAAGIAAGEEVATANAFLLKSEVLR
jgi:cobalt-zinc-cadmium efflux system membrane fusion protein